MLDQRFKKLAVELHLAGPHASLLAVIDHPCVKLFDRWHFRLHNLVSGAPSEGHIAYAESHHLAPKIFYRPAVGVNLELPQKVADTAPISMFGDFVLLGNTNREALTWCTAGTCESLLLPGELRHCSKSTTPN